VNTVADCAVLELPRIAAENGALTPVEGGGIVPFDIARVFYVYDVVGGAERGGHAHYELHQFIVAIMGSLIVTVDDGAATRDFLLNRPYQGLHVPPQLWCDLTDFSGGAVVVVLASHRYDEADYIRDHDDFLSFRRSTASA
jgi:hypothetical protein